MEHFKADRLEELKACEDESAGLEAHIQQMENEAEMQERMAREIIQQQERYRQSMDAKAASIKTKVSENQSATEQLSDYKKMLTTMNEARAKFVKSADADSIKEIKSIMDRGQNPSIATFRLILDKVCQFISRKESASFEVEGKEIFANAEFFSS